MNQHICIICGKTFLGGANAKRCPECRAEYIRAYNTEYKRRQRGSKATKVRGSVIPCERCGEPVVVKGYQTRFCDKCRAERAAQWRKDYYAAHKEEIRAKVREYSRRYHAEHREEHNAKMREEYRKRRERMKNEQQNAKTED